MREYGVIRCGFWRDPEFASLPDSARLLACYLLTCPHGNGLGCFYLPGSYIRADLGWRNNTLAIGYQRLADVRFAAWCERTDYVLIRNFLRWNSVDSPKVAIAREKQYRGVPARFQYRAALASEMLRNVDVWREGFRDELQATVDGAGDTLSIPYRNQDHDPEQDQDQNKNKELILPGARNGAGTNGATVATLPLVDGSGYAIGEIDAGVWQSQFPGVDVGAELGRMTAWLDANPKNRKTKRGVKRFVVNWLGRAQDRAARHG